jgi:hypothetical protein
LLPFLAASTRTPGDAAGDPERPEGRSRTKRRGSTAPVSAAGVANRLLAAEIQPTGGRRHVRKRSGAWHGYAAKWALHDPRLLRHRPRIESSPEPAPLPPTSPRPANPHSLSVGTHYRGRADDSDPAQLVALCWKCDRATELTSWRRLGGRLACSRRTAALARANSER